MPDYDKKLARIDQKPRNVKPPNGIGAYIWEPPGQPFAIQINLSVVDQISQEVMRGFSAVPKRGAEVGGILLGRSVSGERELVEIEAVEMVPIEYRRGPSYLFSDADQKAFDEVYSRLRHAPKEGLQPVGIFRSNTRDSVGLGVEDLALLDKYFPEPDKVVLLIRPFATRVSQAGFYIRENGVFPSGPPSGEFPFRRKDLGGGTPEPLEMPSRDIPPAPQDLVPTRVRTFEQESERPVEDSDQETALREPEPVPAVRSSWMWLPLSFIFLLLGVLLGFQAALSLRPPVAATSPADSFTAGLAVTQEGENLDVRWDRQSPAIRAADQGVLSIRDGKYNKVVVLDANQLRTGSVVYRHTSNDVKFTLELTIHNRDKLLEQAEWKP